MCSGWATSYCKDKKRIDPSATCRASEYVGAFVLYELSAFMCMVVLHGTSTTHLSCPLRLDPNEHVDFWWTKMNPKNGDVSTKNVFSLLRQLSPPLSLSSTSLFPITREIT